MPQLEVGIFDTTQQGAASASRSFANVEQSAKRASDSVGGMEKSLESLKASYARVQVAAGLFGISLGGRELIQIADTWTLTANRLQLYTATARDARQVQGQLFEVAQNSRVSFEGVAQTYTRMAL